MDYWIIAGTRIFPNPSGFHCQQHFKCHLEGNFDWSSTFLVPGPGNKEVSVICFTVCLFLWIQLRKETILEGKRSKSFGTKANLIIAAAAAGALTVIVTQLLQRYELVIQLLLSWSELFDGLGISLLLTANPSISIQYTAFDQTKQRLVKEKMRKKRGDEVSAESLSALSAFMLGAIATCITYPAIRCKVMIQSVESDAIEEDDTQRKSRKTVIGALHAAIWQKEGIPDFYEGLPVQILRTVLSSALLLMIKEKITKTTWVLMVALRRFLLITRTRLKNF